jgi:hypothetical protein
MIQHPADLVQSLSPPRSTMPWGWFLDGCGGVTMDKAESGSKVVSQAHPRSRRVRRALVRGADPQLQVIPFGPECDHRFCTSGGPLSLSDALDSEAVACGLQRSRSGCAHSATWTPMPMGSHRMLADAGWGSRESAFDDCSSLPEGCSRQAALMGVPQARGSVLAGPWPARCGVRGCLLRW